ncbi:MAG: hypothetical protein LQ341_000211 [Variospora aurantia]|nr:MAG: hypothetical protein LQ341_000211 [Variospora aurantia]
METERNDWPRSRRERRRSRPSSPPQQPPEAMSIDSSPAPGLHHPDTKATIARSKSRYKGARPKPSRSKSTPDVPPIPPSSRSQEGVPDQGRIRPNSTFGAFHLHAPAASDHEHDWDDEDEPLITLVQGRSGQRTLQHPAISPDTHRKPRPIINRTEPCLGSAESPYLVATHGERHTTDSHRHQYLEKSRDHARPSPLVKAERRFDGQKHSSPQQEQRRIVLPTRPPVAPKESFTQRIARLVNPPESAAEAKAQLKQMISNPIAIEDRNLVPAEQFDAPKSAVNAGERMVRVKFRDFQIPISIVPSTTPADVIRSVSEKVAHPIDSHASVMLESFKQLGLERPLRRYEHIRDVLNSWDSDSQNTLVIEPSANGGYEDDLEMDNVPRKQPGDSSFYLHHSQRPGHWEKREVALRADGQMLIAKSSGAEAKNICHLSDFDIYVPTARQLAKKIRPPKRICFAVKSQQKSNMFMSTINFVHFFSSNDKKVAKALYTAVQEWRSWYLVNMMGKGVEQPSHPLGDSKQATTRTNIVSMPGDSRHQKRGPQSVPAIQPADLKMSVEASNVSPIKVRRNITTREHPERQIPSLVSPEHTSAMVSARDPFTNDGLLGRAYTEQQKIQQARDTRPVVALAQQYASSTSPVKPPLNELKRTSSQLKKPKPLIDLTPQYHEPPQHSRKGKGVTVGHIPVGGLVDIATSPEVAIPIPPTASWRRPGTSSGADSSPPRNRLRS